jgi:hypothetical protein
LYSGTEFGSKKAKSKEFYHFGRTISKGKHLGGFESLLSRD